MSGSLGYLRGATRCLLCNGEHEPGSVSFGIYGSVSICPGHPIMKPVGARLGRNKSDRGAPRMVAGEIIGRERGKFGGLYGSK